MDYSVRVLVGSSSGWVMFRLNEISGRFGLGRVWFGSGRFQINQFLVKYACHTKTSNFVENFGSGMVQFGSIRILGPLLGEHISGMGPGYSVRVSGLGLVLPGLSTSIFRQLSGFPDDDQFVKSHSQQKIQLI